MNTAEIIKDRLPMRQAVEYYVCEPSRAGFIPCPFHAEKTASMKIYPKSFYCFGCGAGGDVITFVRLLFDLNFRAAVARVDVDFGLGLFGYEITEADRKRAEKANAERRRKEAEAAALKEKRDRYTVMFRELWNKSLNGELSRNEKIKLKVLDDWLYENP